MDMEILSGRNVVGFLILIIIIGLGAFVVTGLKPMVFTSTDELFTGTAATPFTTAGNVLAVTSFAKDAKITTLGTGVPLVGSVGTVPVAIDFDASHSGSAWDAFNITINVTQGLGDKVEWVLGDCRAANITLANASNVYNNIDSSCLSPPAVLALVFNNNGTSANVTGVSARYWRYATSTGYSLASGEITPTADGYYKTTYDYSAEKTAVTTVNTQGQLGMVGMAQIFPNIGLVLGAVILVGVLFFLFKREE